MFNDHTHPRTRPPRFFWSALFRGTYRAIDAAYLRVYLVLEGGQVRAQNANLLACASAEERRHDAKGQTEPCRSVDDESLVATLDVVQPGQLRCGLGVLLDLARERLQWVTKKNKKRNKKELSSSDGLTFFILDRYAHILSYRTATK